jgi:hypothetical protein
MQVVRQNLVGPPNHFGDVIEDMHVSSRQTIGFTRSKEDA